MDTETKQKFGEMNKRFDGIDKRIDTMADFLRRQMMTRDEFDEISEKFATKADINNVLNTLDAGLKMIKDMTDKHIVLKHKVGRHEDWIAKAAPKLKVKYEV